MKYVIILFSILSFGLNAQTFTYDDLNRLIKADYSNGYNIVYEYDKLGNRTRRIVSAGCYNLSSEGAYVQSFEHGLGNWVQLESDNENWTHESGPTASSSTGPTAAEEKLGYVYTEASSRTSKTMTLQSGCYTIPSSGDYTLSFDYHMYGTRMGTLRAQISVNEGAYSDIFFKSGDQGNQWHLFEKNMSGYRGKTVHFKILATTGSGYQSDMAIDNIRIDSGCPDNLVVYFDNDRDGFGAGNPVTVNACSPPDGYAINNTDCDDTKNTVYPNAPEICDGLDNDCNGSTDEISCNCQEDHLDIPNVNQNIYFARSTINSTATIPQGDNITYKAGNSITLEAGFHTQAGSSFSASIESCNNANFSNLNENITNSPKSAAVHLLESNSPSSINLKIYPNPFNKTTKIVYILPEKDEITIKVINIFGQEVAILEKNSHRDKGIYTVDFTPKNQAIGTFYILLQGKKTYKVKKMIRIR